MTNTLYIPVTPTLMAGGLNFMQDSSTKAEVLFIKFNYLPALHNQFHQLVIDVVNSSQALRDTALTAKIYLEKNLNALHYLDTELKDAQRVERDVIAERTALPANVKSKMRELKDLLSQQLSSIQSPSVLSLTPSYLSESEKALADAEAALVLLNEEKTTLQGQRQILTAAIDAFSQSAPEAVNKDTSLTQQSLTQLGMASPKIAIIMLAIGQVKESLGNISEGIRFKDLVRQRDELATKITNQSTSITLKTKQIATFKGQTDFINTLHNIDIHLKIYTNEYQHVIQNFQSFIMQTDADFQVQAQQFIKNLTPLSYPW